MEHAVRPAVPLELHPIGHIETVWHTIEQCPRNIGPDNPSSSVHVDPRYRDALLGMMPGHSYDILYWLDRADRSDACLIQTSRRNGAPTGVFCKRSPHRPNPIGLSRVRLRAIRDLVLEVDGLDCLDGTPLLDIKPAVTRKTIRPAR